VCGDAPSVVLLLLGAVATEHERARPAYAGLVRKSWIAG
jgi:hypothetical protein